MSAVRISKSNLPIFMQTQKNIRRNTEDYRNGRCKHSVDFNVNGVSAIYDAARTGVILWGSGSIIERVVSLNALFRDRLPRINRVARHWLQLAFADGNAWAGSFQKAFFAGVGKEALTGDIPEACSLCSK